MARPYLEQAQARVGTTARKWTLDRLIDVGGMAAVYGGTHRNGNQVAIKVLHKNYAEMPEAKERFLREGYVANKVGHKDAVTVLDDDQLDDGTPFLVMELLLGHPLESYLRSSRKILPAQILFVAHQILDVLAAAHENGIIHRDIKPGNIFITQEGAAKVLDFGLARVLDPGSNWSATRTGTVIGTASYMSPEQARGKREMVDHRTDIYAVGAVIFRALTGRTPHVADSPMDRLLLVMTEKAPSLASFLPGAPADLVALVDRALAFQKADRFATAREMQDALRVVYQANTGAPLPTGPQLVPPPVRQDAVSGADDVHVNVAIEEPGGDSIFVEFSDIDTGRAARFRLRKTSSPPAIDSDGDAPLSEVSVVFDED